MTNTQQSTTIEIPPAADDARGMAMRVVEIASTLANLGIKPSSLSCGLSYMYGWPGTLPPPARDAVSVHVDLADHARLCEMWGLVVYEAGPETPISRRIHYGSGVVNGVAVQIYAGSDS